MTLLAPATHPSPLRVLYITASPRGVESESRRLSQDVLQALARQAGQRTIERTDLDVHQLPGVDRDYTFTLASPIDPDSPPASETSLYRSNQLITQLDAADVVVIATPMHNFTLPAALKTWVDHIVRIRVTFQATPQGKVGILRDRPVYVAIASGGFISGERARQPDFLRPYLKYTLGTVGLHDVHFVTVEGTALGDAALQAGRAQAREAVAALLGEQAAGLPAAAEEMPSNLAAD